MRSKMSSYLYVFLLLITALVLYPISFIEATGIVDSGHNMLRQSNFTDTESGKAGVCSFCHIPHSTGAGMVTTSQPDGVVRIVTGAVGVICSSCHGRTIGRGSAPYFADANNPFIFSGAQFNHPLMDNDSDFYGTDQLAGYTTLTSVNTGTKFGGTKQWLSGWPATGRARRGLQNMGDTTMIECTSCHNVHSVTPGLLFDQDGSNNAGLFNGKGSSRKFLRALPFDTMAAVGNELENRPDQNDLHPKQVFCEYCHIGRARMGTGPWNTTTIDGSLFSTHPIGIPGPGVTDNGRNNRKIIDDNKGWDSSLVIDPMFKTGDTTMVQDGGRTGHTGFINAGAGNGDRTGMGFGTTRLTGVIICQSCHQPHSTMANALPGQSHDGAIISDPQLMFDSIRQDLLVETNRASDGYNRLCENCHSYRPFLAVRATNNLTGDSPTMVGHPLKHHKYGAGSYPATVDWVIASASASATCQDDDDTGGDSITIPTNWPTGGTSNLQNQVVCLSCHEVHGAKPRTKLLRAVPLCVECHDGPIKKLGITHPVQVGLASPDGGTWPDQASFSLFTPPQYDTGSTYDIIRSPEKMYPTLTYAVNSGYATFKSIMVANSGLGNGGTFAVRIDCGTCHDYINGNIHYDIARRRDPQGEVNSISLARYDTATTPVYAARRHRHRPQPNAGTGNIEDPNANSEICVACHTLDNFGYRDDETIVNRENVAQTGNEGEDNGQSANPSPWIKEYSINQTGKWLAGVVFFADGNPTERATTGTTNLMEPEANSGLSARLGTHAAGVRVTQDGSQGTGKKSRLTWVYVGRWGDTTGTAKEDPLYAGSGTGDPCRKAFTGKYSKWGPAIDNLGPVNTVREAARGSGNVICQSCHIPHYAAAGLVEYNSGSINKEASPHSALLYATQAESFLCRNCHDQGGGVVHPFNQPTQAKYIGNRDLVDDGHLDWYNSTAYVGGARGMRRSDKEHIMELTREGETRRVSDSTAPFYLRGGTLPAEWGTTYLDAGGYRWGVNMAHGPAKPANYPRSGGSLNNGVGVALPGSAVDTTFAGGFSVMVCDSCHAPHAAGTTMGTYILEGQDSTVPKIGSSNKADYPFDHGNGKAQPSRPNDAPTCILCHIQ